MKFEGEELRNRPGDPPGVRDAESGPGCLCRNGVAWLRPRIIRHEGPLPRRRLPFASSTARGRYWATCFGGLHSGPSSAAKEELCAPRSSSSCDGTMARERRD